MGEDRTEAADEQQGRGPIPEAPSPKGATEHRSWWFRLFGEYEAGMDERARQDALRLLRAAKNIFAEQHGNNDEWFWAGTPVDLVAAGERVGMPVGWPDHDAAVRWLESENAIEAAELTRNVVGGKFYLVTAHGVELVR